MRDRRAREGGEKGGKRGGDGEGWRGAKSDYVELTTGQWRAVLEGFLPRAPWKRSPISPHEERHGCGEPRRRKGRKAGAERSCQI